MMVCLIFHTTIIINRPSSLPPSPRRTYLLNVPARQFLLIVEGCFFYLDRLFYTTPTFAFFFLQSEAGSSNKRHKTKSCRHQSHEGIFVTEIDKYIASFFFDDKGLKLSLLN